MFVCIPLGVVGGGVCGVRRHLHIHISEGVCVYVYIYILTFRAVEFCLDVCCLGL